MARSEQERFRSDQPVPEPAPHSWEPEVLPSQPSPARNSRTGGIVLQRSHCGGINRDVLKYLYMPILVSEQSRSERADPHSRLNS